MFALRRGGLLTAKEACFSCSPVVYCQAFFSRIPESVCLSVLHTRVEKMSCPEMRERLFPFEVHPSAVHICHLAPHPWLQSVERDDGQVEKVNK